MIKLNLDVSKINKDKLFVGKKGTYLNMVLVETPNSEYGDYMMVEETTKEEYEAGVKGTILGNGKIVIKNTEESRPITEGEKEDLPF